MAEESRSGGGFVPGLLLGLLAGAALAMLASPQSGENTRATLRAKGREAADATRDAAGDLGTNVAGTTSDLLERGRAIVENARARVDGAIAEGREAAEQQRTELENRT
jgi:gas vesicle protein